ncbi:hypothetical protein CLAFUW4_00127 [Fulvia fulva]|uniref:uncharacterized protein n=1 Tax=Passalora fulva TaxID=5499 RepID=UPI0004E9E62F|nr:uncharacterized protein CLAFUR5_20116 [Fulvia fulva]KAK4638644.1 hypothetical protein CLAFUR0_00125 [Fulvia fulva]WMI38742.1 hypothetical protein CLAFUR5_20116 [Fulvia fulva]WPV09174.1 hypothetical protein CLAFUW4_00127 [Fulvia fulva]WPV25177.1 hypothetical protein CLAFUW7_00127 [Fulvia fulva]
MEDSDAHVIAPNDDCNRDCADCVAQFTGAKLCMYPLAAVRQQMGISDSVARKRAEELASAAKANQSYLMDKLAQHGNAIASKWRKMNRNKREATILQAQPTLYPHKYIESRVTYQVDGSEAEIRGFIDRTEPEKYHNAFLLPYLNLEDWVAFDSYQMKNLFDAGCLLLKYNDNCIILHGERYGELVPYDRKKAHYQDIIGYTRGIFILEAQSVLLQFLRNTTDILVTAESQNRGDERLTALVMSDSKASGEVECWSPFGNGAFSSVPRFAPEHLLRNAKAQLAAAEDHLRFMQTDPAYLQHWVQQQRRLGYYSNLGIDKTWDYITSDIMVYPVQHVRKLRWVVGELENILDVYKRFRDQIHIGSPLPKKFDRAMSALEFLCINLYQVERKELTKQLRKTPGFQEDYDYTKKDANGQSGSTLRWIHGYDSVDGAYFRLKPLHFALLKLTNNPEDNDSIAPSWLMSFIDDHLANGDSKEHAKIDQTLYDHLARMTCYFELVSAVRLHRPCPRAMSYDSITAEEMERPVWKLWRKPTGNMTDLETRELAGLLRGFCKTPWPSGKRDQAWSHSASGVRDGLQAFWATARRVARREVTGIGFDEVDVGEYVELFSADQADEHRAELSAEIAAAEKVIATTQAQESDGQKSATAPQSSWGDGKSNKFEPVLEKVKAKTRPDGSASPSDAAVDDLANLRIVDEPATPRIAVNAESMRIFARMFPVSVEDVFKGLVKWQQVVTAMADAGFSATHTGGSAVHFDPTVDLAAAGSIVFHKPHPDPNVDPIMLQTMGKRMRKWFGWDGDSFVERARQT